MHASELIRLRAHAAVKTNTTRSILKKIFSEQHADVTRASMSIYLLFLIVYSKTGNSFYILLFPSQTTIVKGSLL